MEMPVRPRAVSAIKVTIAMGIGPILTEQREKDQIEVRGNTYFR